ncbi:Hsp20 family protein [Fastidiosibacter lacustris]|uniref:Hsp20 family protein n=1 Tax=Fastidiosibacter lacustris TaxID=2056695 RepID=UPI000E352463|nr:Hsp20 family protein [Fastidiosibacter lacustris]
MNTLDSLVRNAIGFDRLFALAEAGKPISYPPYNIEVLGKQDYLISMAIAGFNESEIDITVHQGKLTVTGSKIDDNKERKFIHRGIAERSFTHTFELADHIEVKGAQFENGILNISLIKEVPEAMQPKKIKINNQPHAQTIEQVK